MPCHNKCERAFIWLVSHIKFARVFLLLLATIGFVISKSVAAQEIIRIGGTGTGTLLIRYLGEEYKKIKPDVEVRPILPPMGSNGSLRALASGSIQIAIVTFPDIYPAPDQADKTKANEVVPWVRTPFVFTGRDFADGTRLSLAEVADIYSGRLVQWPSGKQVRLITRTERESDTRILRAISPVMDEAVFSSVGRHGMPFAENDLDNQQLLEHTAGSFGSIGLGQLLLMGSPLKPIILDGKPPSAESLQSGAYRLEKPLYLVTNKALSPASLEFIHFLRSSNVVKKIRKYGFIPMHHD